MMSTDLASVAPAGRHMRASEADLASVVETTWHERSPRPNHGSLPGAETSAHTAMERLTAHATVKSGRASGRDAEHSYCGECNKRVCVSCCPPPITVVGCFRLSNIGLDPALRSLNQSVNQVALSRVRSGGPPYRIYKCVTS